MTSDNLGGEGICFCDDRYKVGSKTAIKVWQRVKGDLILGQIGMTLVMNGPLQGTWLSWKKIQSL